MIKYFRIFTLLALFPLTSVLSGGLDLDLYYGTRYVGLGGNHVGLTGDAYSPFYNPAGMTSVEGGVIAVDSSSLIHQYEAPIGADNAQRKSEWNFGPLFYAGGVYSVSDRIALGFGVFPTALQGGKFKGVNYTADAGQGAGAGVAPLPGEISNMLVRIEFAPSIAIKLIEHVSLGLSYRIGYTRFDNTSGVFAGNNSAIIDTSVDGWDAAGLKMGTFLDNWNGLSAGITYRLEVKPDMSGSSTVTTLAGSSIVSTTMSPRIPAQLQAGVSYQWTPKFMTAFTYEYTYNSALDQISLQTPAGTLGVADGKLVTPLNDHDSHAFHMGAEYAFHLAEGNKLTTQLGLAVDTSATSENFPNPVLQSPAVYVGYAGGVQYEFDVNTLGLALNYGKYSGTGTADPSLAAKAFTGKYGLEVWLVVADYQVKF